MRGRKPKPTAMKLLEGNPGHRPLNVGEARLEADEATFEMIKKKRCNIS